MTTARRIHQLHAWAGACVVAAAVAAAPGPASGQTTGRTDFQRGTALAGFAGVASTTSREDVAAGAAIAWELTPHFTVEARGIWLDAGPRANAFSALLGARIPLLPGRPVVPFVSAGAGVYRTTFDTAVPAMPRFYQRRMMPRLGEGNGSTFNDFTVAIGGGADLALARHLSLRPELTILFVTTRSSAHAVPVFGAQVAYHFESHPITPAVR